MSSGKHFVILPIAGVKSGKRCLQEGLLLNRLDAKPHLVPCANGVIDLRTGKNYRSTARDYLLRSVSHNFNGFDAPAPVWEKTLSEIFNGNRVVIEFLQRLLGYMLLGNAREHVFAVLWGTTSKSQVDNPVPHE
ncbi:MAG: hypothetical protein HXX11_06285 [Desulfuromonadales bacterium]|nr:hypothetical protein [Desulfuromonadales bacterium]